MALLIAAGCQSSQTAPGIAPQMCLRETVPAPAIRPVAKVLPQDDLWARLRRGFSLDHHVDQKRVQYELRWFDRHPQYLARMQERMGRFLPYVADAVEQRQLPAELVLMPIVESALDPYAFSPTGAAGLWQFMPATGRRYGLVDDHWYDGRLDLVAATEAALTLLEDLHERFDSWLVAVAAYNAGEGNLRKALRRAEPEADFFALRVPRETRQYVPRLLALAAVIADPDVTEMAVPDVMDVPQFTVVDTGSQLEIGKAAQVLGLSVEDLYRWNPALESWSTPPAGPHRLLVPHELYDTAQTALNALSPEERLSWHTVRVGRGDTLSEIAERYRTDVETIRASNNIRGHLIRAGQDLLVPTGQAAPAPPGPSAQRGVSYEVRPGDSLWEIARRHGSTVGTLRKANRISRHETLRVGRVITIPGQQASAAGAGPPAVYRSVTYSVRRGDSLAKIAQRFGVTVGEISRWNGINPSRYLQPGQRLKMRVTVVGG